MDRLLPIGQGLRNWLYGEITWRRTWSESVESCEGPGDRGMDPENYVIDNTSRITTTAHLRGGRYPSPHQITAYQSSLTHEETTNLF
ncbi:hypothetical protein FOBRF1_001862 [Fusarium oxysporum]